MKRLIALDMGTTNTRAYLLDANGNILKTAKLNIGAGQTAKSSSKEPVINAVKICIAKLGNWENVAAVIASGMITSNLGLKEIPHLSAPVDIKTLSDNMVCESFPEITDIPFFFIPGVKNNTDNIEEMDMMRGEETESAALMETAESALFVLPGSHTKFVSVKNGKITSCLTTLTGELLSLITKETVAAQAVEHNFADIKYFDKEYLLKGCKAAEKYGAARAVFGTRILRVLSDTNEKQAAWYLLGAVLQGDIAAIKGANLSFNTAVIAGKEPFVTAWKTILEEEELFGNVIFADNSIPLAAKGAYILAKNRKII